MIGAKEYQTDGPDSLAGQLLRVAATGGALECGDRAFGWQPKDGDLRQFEWILEAGLGPLLVREARGCTERVPSSWRQTLTSADLSARIWHAERVETALEIIDACDHLDVPVTLLKGVSVSEEWYPAEHLRPMGDIDALVPAEACAAIERSLLERGYRRVEDWIDIPGLQHGAPLCHPRLDTVVELHTQLFSAKSALAANSAFGPARLIEQSIASRYHGRAVRRLRPEAQLAYIASSWFNDIIHYGVQPSFLPSAFDATYLLAAVGRTLDWDRLLGWLDNELAQASLYAMLSYLPRHGVEPAPSGVLERLASGQRLVGPIQLRLIHRVLDRHLFGARYWNLVLPPPMPARYSLRFQFRKRIMGRWQGGR